MNGRCDNDPLDRAENVCDKCGGDFCDSCLLYPRGKKRAPICKACAISAAGLRSGSKGNTPMERKNVRKRRKELKETSEREGEEQQFIFFDDPDSDIELRDRSVLEPPVEEEPKRRFARKSKAKDDASDDRTASESKRSKKPKKTSKSIDDTIPVTADLPAPNGDMPPPPRADDIVEDPEETVDLGEALGGYGMGRPADLEALNADPIDTHVDPFSAPALSNEPASDTPTGDVAAPVADGPGPSNVVETAPQQTGSASELLERLKEAESSRGPMAIEPDEPYTRSDDPWLPPSIPSAASSFDTTVAETSMSDTTDMSVNPFAATEAQNAPMEPWQPPPVTPDAPLSAIEAEHHVDYLSYQEPAPLTTSEPSFEPFGSAPDDTPAFEPFDAAPTDPAPNAEAAPQGDAPPWSEVHDFNNEISFEHDPAFSDEFSGNEYGHNPGFGQADEPAFEPTAGVPAMAAADPISHSFNDFDTGGANPFDDGSPKADTDDEGNWIPPALRGMAPKEERDADLLPKRRNTDGD